MDTLDEILALWKRNVYDRHGFVNTETLHTFDKVYDIVANHITSVVKRFSNINLRGVEKVVSIEAARAHDRLKEALERNLLPRAVVLYNLETQADPLYDVTSQQQIHRVSYSGAHTLINIRRPKGKDKHDWRYMKDHDVSLKSAIRHNCATIFYTIYTASDGEAIELHKLFKFLFPVEVFKPIYAERTDNYMDKRPNPDIKFYTLETVLPIGLINVLKKTFGINDVGTLGDTELLKILQQHSDYPVDYIVNGARRERAFVIKYPCNIMITPKDISTPSKIQEDVPTYMVRLELMVDWIEHHVYNLKVPIEQLNTDAEILRNVPAEGELIHQVPILVAHFSEFWNGLAIMMKVQLTAGPEDVVYIDRGADMPPQTYISYDLTKLLPDNKPLEKYIDFIFNCYDEEEVPNYLHAEAKKVRLKKEEVNDPDFIAAGTDPNFFINPSDLVLTDIYGKEGDETYVALYVNKKHFSDWMQENGYTTNNNISEYN